MKADSFETLRREEARQRVAALRRARASRRAARAEQRKAGLFDGSAGRITNLRQVLQAMAKYAD